MTGDKKGLDSTKPKTNFKVTKDMFKYSIHY